MKKPLFDQVSIVGVGLLGGSLGLAVKKRRLARTVVGVVRRRRTAIEAVSVRAVDVATLDLREGVRGADLVILCAPVSTIASQLGRIGPWLKPGALVTDVGSSKAEIERAAQKFFRPAKRGPAPVFAGSHPMAGLEKKGVLAARADLFEGATCFVTRPEPRLERFWSRLGALPVRIGARAHDAWVAHFSHLPHILAFTLFQRLPERPGKLTASNPSLRDLARVSKSDPKLWADILLSNQKELLRVLPQFRADLGRLEKALRAGRFQRVRSFVARSNRNSHRAAPNAV